LKLQYDETLSNFAFNFNLRHYTTVSFARDQTRLIAEEIGVAATAATNWLISGFTAGAYTRPLLSST
jgi:hypothetical protein